jgi:adenylosuccinate lyase
VGFGGAVGTVAACHGKSSIAQERLLLSLALTHCDITGSAVQQCSHA